MKEKNKAIEFKIGDQIEVGKYTATCQKVCLNGLLGTFMLDQYLDKAYVRSHCMLNRLEHDLTHDENFEKLFKKNRIVCMDNQFFRLPTAGEFFSKEAVEDYFEPDHEDGTWDDQWELMKDRKNRIALREGDKYEWGLLKNRHKVYTTSFAAVYYDGCAGHNSNSKSHGIRPVFYVRLLDRNDKERSEIIYESLQEREKENNRI